MKLKLDENLSRHLKAPLSSLGHDVSTAADEGLLGQPDSLIAGEAFAEKRMLLMLDLEFGSVIKFPPGKHPGIILFRLVELGPLAVNRFVEEFGRLHCCSGARPDASALAEATGEAGITHELRG